MKLCNIADCEKVVRARGWCSTHYARWKTHGDPEHTEWSKTTEDRFWEKVRITPYCWEWLGARSKGHGVIYLVEDRSMSKAHRYSYELVHGKVEATYFIDHWCRNRGCVNPAHLRLATVKENGENRDGLDANNSSGYRGVSWSAYSNKWYVRVYHRGKCFYGGQYTDVHEAGEVARQLRIKLFTHNVEDLLC